MYKNIQFVVKDAFQKFYFDVCYTIFQSNIDIKHLKTKETLGYK